MRLATVDFRFIFQDVKRQRELAQQALDEAKRIAKRIHDNSEAMHQEYLEDAKAKWLAMAQLLAVNAATTSQRGAATISAIRLFGC